MLHGSARASLPLPARADRAPPNPMDDDARGDSPTSVLPRERELPSHSSRVSFSEELPCSSRFLPAPGGPWASLPGYDPARGGALRVSAHFAAHHPAFRGRRGAGAAAAAPGDDGGGGGGGGGAYETVLRMHPAWAAKLRGTVERLAARDGPSKSQRRKENKKKRREKSDEKARRKAAAAAPAPAPDVDVEALAAAARAYAARSAPAEPEAPAPAADDDDAALREKREAILSWVS